jgi:hypothetical protein
VAMRQSARREALRDERVCVSILRGPGWRSSSSSVAAEVTPSTSPESPTATGALRSAQRQAPPSLPRGDTRGHRC